MYNIKEQSILVLSNFISKLNPYLLFFPDSQKNLRLFPLNFIHYILKKKTIFKIISFFLPVLLLVVIEIGLKIGGYGERYTLFKTMRIKNRPDYLVMNSDISKKYFKGTSFTSDNQSDIFLKTKTDSTFRVFVQGASTVVGFPYYHGGSFPRMLKHRLSQTFPEKNIEVINTGITAVNSYTLYDLTDQIIEQNPDLVLIYTGHNEYYGALGAGSSSAIKNHPLVVRSYLYLKNFRFFQLMDNSYSKLFNRKKSSLKVGETNLMEVMAKEQRIPLNSKVFKAGINQFENNLDNILREYQKNGIPVILSTVVSNEKNIRPFISDSIHNKNEFNQALKTKNIESIHKTVQNNAMAAYKLGQFYLVEKQSDSAKKYFHRAKELDFLRFRAPDKINTILTQLSKKYNCPLIDMQTVFSAHSQNGIIGDELLLEHVHPNVKGYFVMADAFYNKMRELNLPENWSNCIPFEAAQQDIPITQIDSIKGELIVKDLKRSWPYTMSMSGKLPQSVFHYIKKPSYEEKKAFIAYMKKDQWQNVMIEAFNTYKQTKEYTKALRIAQSLIFEYPEQTDTYQEAGALCLKLNNPKKASYYFIKANQLEMTRASAEQLASVYIELNQIDLAKKTLTDAKRNGIMLGDINKTLQNLKRKTTK